MIGQRAETATQQFTRCRGAHARRPHSPRSSRRRARCTAPLGALHHRARPAPCARDSRPSVAAPISPRDRAAHVNLGTEHAWRRRLRLLDLIAQPLAGLVFPALIVPARFSTSSESVRRARRTVTFGASGSGASATVTSASRKRRRRAHGSSQPDAGAVVAAVDHAQIPTDATCPGELRRLSPALAWRIGSVARAGRKGALAWMRVMRAVGGSSGPGSADSRGRPAAAPARCPPVAGPRQHLRTLEKLYGLTFVFTGSLPFVALSRADASSNGDGRRIECAAATVPAESHRRL